MSERRAVLLAVSDDSAWLARLAQSAQELGLDFRRGRAPEPGGHGVLVCDWSAQTRFDRLPRAPGFALALAAQGASSLATHALAHGADGVLDKACSRAELSLRLRRLCRRAAAADPGLCCPTGDLRLEPRGRVFFRRRGAWRPGPALPELQARLLRRLLERPGQVLSRTELLESVWDERSGSVNGEALDKQVAALRRKLGAHGRALRTARGSGYGWLGRAG